MNLVTGRRDVLRPARRALNKVSFWIRVERYKVYITAWLVENRAHNITVRYVAQ